MPARRLDELLGKVHELSQKTLAPRAEITDEQGRWPKENLEALLEAGLGGLVLPERLGGLGQGMYGLVRVCEVLGRSCASTAMCFGMHAVASAVLAAKATPDHEERYLRPIARGEHLTTLALSEPGTGSHFYIPRTLVRTEKEHYVLEGTKSFVTNGGHTDSIVLSAVAAEDDAPPGEFSCFVVPNDAENLTWGPPWRGSGMRGNSSRTVELQGVRIPRTEILGAAGEQTWYLFHVVTPYFVSAMAGTYLGVGQAALDDARNHLKERRHDHVGQTLSQNPILQHRLGTLWADQEKARRLVHHAAMEGDSGGPESMPALLSAKAEAADTAVRVSSDALSIMGGRGYAEGGRLDRHLRDARAGPIMAPTSDMLRTWCGRWLLGEPLLVG